MERVEKFVKEHPLPIVALLAAAVVLVVYMLWTGCKIAGFGLRKEEAKKAEGIGAGGPQVNDNALLPAGYEGFHVRKFEGIVADGIGDSSLRAAIAVEKAAELRKQLGCKAASEYRGLDHQALAKDTTSAEAGWKTEGMTGTDAKLRAALTGN
jgi:hypothetical protein